ncbi:hypothetical protein M3Y97_00642400 [Aphelenchoides bicaudatus]|nr:hypothetical protein M3Y97_00642400 [Aphelenchoides bicaudatus]
MNCSKFPTFRVSPNCPFVGLFVESRRLDLAAALVLIVFVTLFVQIINAIAEEMDLELVKLTDKENKIPLSEAQYMLENDTIDVIALGFQKTEVREARFEFSKPLYWARTRLLRRNPDGQMEQMFSFFQTYEQCVWMAFGVMLILQWIFCMFVQKLETRAGWKKQTSVVDSAWQLFRLLLQQPDKFPVQSTLGKLSIYIYSLLQCTILLGLFSSFILASIIKPKAELEDPIHNMIDKIKTGHNYMVTSDADSWFYEKVNNSKEGIYRQIRHALDINRLRVVEDREEALWFVANDDAFLHQQVDEWSFYRAMQRCDVVALEKYMPPVEANLMFRKNHPLLPDINVAIERLRIKLTGISWKYYEYAISMNKCPSRKEYRPLQLTPYVGLCAISMIIISVAILTLFLEIVVAYFQRRINQKLKY